MYGRITVPTDLAHYLLIIDVFESIRQGLPVPIDTPCSSAQEDRDFNVGKTIVTPAVAKKTTTSWRKSWLARPRGQSLDEWIVSVAAQPSSIELALFRTDESEMPRWVQASFANMGNYGLAVTTPRGTVPIEAIWRPNKATKLWDVEFHEAHRTPHIESKSLNESYGDFLRVLRDIGEFAKRSDRYEFVPVFESALDVLEAGGEMTRYAGQLLDEAIFTPGARQLFEGVGRCWVFGGMGSWNDIIIRDPVLKREHEAVTGRFYDALMQAVLSIANKGRRDVER
jgi:hypothetical protein